MSIVNKFCAMVLAGLTSDWKRAMLKPSRIVILTVLGVIR